MANLLFAWIKNHFGDKFYPYTHSDAVYVNDMMSKNLTTSLDEIDEKINQVSEIQSDWSENDSTKNTYIKNKPSALPANGGDADTLGGISSSGFVIKGNFDNHLSDIHAHDNLFNKKLDIKDANKLIKEIYADTESGIITVTRLDNTIFSINVPKNIILKSACFDESNNEIVIIWSDDSESHIPVSGLVDIYTGSDGSVIQIVVDENNVISAIVKEGSVSRTLLSTEIQTDLDKAHIHTNADALSKISDEFISDFSEHVLDASKHIPNGGTVGQIMGMTETGIGWVENESSGNSQITKVSELENDLNYVSEDNLGTALSLKIDKVDGMGLSENSYTNEDKEKLNGIDLNANNYVHPDMHPATMITEDDTHKFITSEEKSLIRNGISNVTFDEETSVLTFNTLQGDKNIDLSSLQKTVMVGMGDEITPGFNENMIWHQGTFQDMNYNYSQCKYMKNKFFILTKTNYWLMGENPENLALKNIREMDSSLPDTVVVGNIFFIEDNFYICSYNSDSDYTFNLHVTSDFVNYEKYSSSHLLNGIEGIEKLNGKYIFVGKLTVAANRYHVFYLNALDELDNDINNNNKESDTSLYSSANVYVVGGKIKMLCESNYYYIDNDTCKLVKKQCSPSPKYGRTYIMDNRLLNIGNNSNNRFIREFLKDADLLYNKSADISTFSFINNILYCNATYIGGKYLFIKNNKGIIVDSLEDILSMENEENMFSICNQNIESLCHDYEYILLGTQDRYLFAKIS